MCNPNIYFNCILFSINSKVYIAKTSALVYDFFKFFHKKNRGFYAHKRYQTNNCKSTENDPRLQDEGFMVGRFEIDYCQQPVRPLALQYISESFHQ